MTGSARFLGCRLPVHPDWIDANGHLNVGYYAVAFDLATDALLDHVQLGDDYRRDTGFSVFVLESHATYLQEVANGDPLVFRTRVLDTDSKRIHIMHEMHHEKRTYLASTMELMILHVDLRTRRAAALPEDRQKTLARLALDNPKSTWPAQCGRTIGIRRPVV